MSESPHSYVATFARRLVRRGRSVVASKGLTLSTLYGSYFFPRENAARDCQQRMYRLTPVFSLMLMRIFVGSLNSTTFPSLL